MKPEAAFCFGVILGVFVMAVLMSHPEWVQWIGTLGGLIK